MLTVDKLRCKPKRFHPFTGLTPDEFDTLLLRVESVYAAAQESRLNYPCRQRALGQDIRLHYLLLNVYLNFLPSHHPLSATQFVFRVAQ